MTKKCALKVFISISFLLLFSVVKHSYANDAEQLIYFNITLHEVGEGLISFGQQAGITVVYRFDSVKNCKTNKLKGKYSISRAIELILENTCLTAEFDQSGNLIIKKNEDPDKDKFMKKFIKKHLSETIALSLQGLLVATTIPVISIAYAAESLEKKDEVEIITVVASGFAESLKKSLNVKRNSDGVSEALSAEDIGKLPDISVAESLARLPGVTATREVAGAGSISIRGMGSILTSGTLNGRDLASINGDRSVAYSEFPSELIVGASVYKTSSASNIEGGIAGSVDLQTIKPLQQDGQTITANVRTRYNDMANDLPEGDAVGYRGSISYIDQFNDNTLGVVFGYSGQDAPFVSAESSVFNSRTVGFGGWLFPVNDEPHPDSDDSNGTVDFNVPYGADNGISSGTSTRHAFLGAIQWQPHNNLDVNADILFSDFSSEGKNIGLQAGGYGNWGNEWSNVVNDENNLIGGTATCSTCSGAIDGQNLRALNAIDRSDRQTLGAGINIDYNTETWNFVADLGYSKATSDAFFANLSFRPYDNTTDKILNPISTFGENNNSAAFITSPLNFADPETNRVDTYRIFNDSSAEDEILSIKFDATKDIELGVFQYLNLGIRFVDRDNEYTKRSASTSLLSANALPLTSDLVKGTFSIEDDVNSNFTTNPVLVIDTQRIINEHFASTVATVEPLNSYKLNEKISSAYVQLDFEQEFSDSYVTGNIGVRYVKTELEATGTKGLNGVNTMATETNDYDHVLPSVNINYHPTEDVIVRLGLARAIARPALVFLNPGIEQWGDQAFNGAGGGGNPQLQPYEADQIDLSIEKYFSDDTAVTFALFYKDLDTFITNDVRVDNGITIYSPANGSGGYIRGGEILWQQNFDILPENWGTVGIYANYSYTESNVELSEQFDSATYGLDGLSKHVGNVTFHHTLGKLGTRISYRYRDDFTRPQRPGRAFITNKGEGDLSFQVSYEFTDKLEVALQGWNLLDEERDSYNGNPAIQGQYRVFGRNLELGASYKF